MPTETDILKPSNNVQAIEKAAQEAISHGVKMASGEYFEVHSDSAHLVILCDKHGVMHAWAAFKKVI